MPPRQSPRPVLLQRPRHQHQSASHHKGGAQFARKARAIGDESRLPARYGQNNPAIALNRKNALFAGSDGGGEQWAVIASLIETCKLCQVEPQAYLADVITRIVTGHPNNQIDQLLPWAYIKQVA